MFDLIQRVMRSGGYPGIVFLMFAENVFPPIPSELIMPLAGFMTRTEDLWIVAVIVAGVAGSVLGNLPLYWVGRRVGQKRLARWVDKHGRWLAMSPNDLDKSRQWFERHGAKAVLFARMVPGVRSLISIPAGVNQMNVATFLLYTTIGSFVWISALALAGRALGSNYEKVETIIGPASNIVMGMILLFYVYRVIQLSRKSPVRPGARG